MELLGSLIDYRNIHLAYERAKNHLINRELHSFQEQKAFEPCIPNIYEDIRSILKSPDTFQFQKIEILYKPKDWDVENGWEMRPLARMSFYDSVVIQCVMNIVGELIAPILPSRNFGYRLRDKDSISMYEHWKWGYAKFTDAEIQAIKGNNSYQYVLELDIKDFYPSIDHSILLEQLKPYLTKSSYVDNPNKKEGIILTWIKKILSIPQIDAFGKPIDFSGIGVPQGLLYSPLLAMFYIRDCFKELKPLLIRTEYFAYVDDFRFYCGTNERAADIEERLITFFDKLKLKINKGKTNIMSIDSVKIDEADIMGRASNLGRAMRNEVILSSNGKNAIKASLYNLMNEVRELYADLLERDKCKKKLELKMEKFALYRIVQLAETDEEWDDLARKLNDIDMLKSNYAGMVHILHNFASTTQQKQRFLGILEGIILNKEYAELTYIKYVTLQYCFIWSPYEIKLTQLRITSIIDNLINIINRETVTKTFLKAILSKCHEDWYKLILDRICEMEVGTDRELNTILHSAISKSGQTNSNIEYPKEYGEQVVAKLEQSHVNLIYRVFHSNSIEKEYLKYLNDETFKNIKYLKFRRNAKDLGQNDVRVIKLPQNRVSLKEYGSKINDDSKLYILGKIFEWLFVQLNYKKLPYIKIPCSVINPEYIWFHPNIDENKGDIILLGNPFLNNEIYYRKVPESMWKTEFIGLFQSCYNIDIRESRVEMLSESIQFWLFRIIQLLKARNFRLEEFIQICLGILRNLDFSDKLTVSSEHFRLSHLVNHYIPTPYLHDNFIEITRFVESSWKNGSKECYFFTLHNHEHARVLIYVIHDFIEKTGFKIYLNQREAFRLFAACFLHDVGMLSKPPETGLFSEPIPEEINIIFSELLKPLVEAAAAMSSVNIEVNSANKKRIFAVSELVDQLKMNIIRAKHNEISKNEILWDYPNLPLTTAERRDIADLCNAHGINIEEVNSLADNMYDGRSPINLKILSFLLRLADLCDVSYMRISKEVLERNEDRMGKDSLFHWIKHMSVERIEIVCNDRDNSQAKINIYHNYLPWMYVKESDLKKACGNECKKNRNIKYIREENPVPLVEYVLDEESSCIEYLNSNVCNLLCAFVNKAYRWFYPEVVAINRYFKELGIGISLDLSIFINEDKRKMDFLFVENRNVQRSVQEFIMDYLLHI